MVPARRQDVDVVAHTNEEGSLDSNAGNTSVLIGTVAVQIVPEKIKPTFRTPCRYFHVGTIELLIWMLNVQCQVSIRFDS